MPDDVYIPVPQSMSSLGPSLPEMSMFSGRGTLYGNYFDNEILFSSDSEDAYNYLSQFKRP